MVVEDNLEVISRIAAAAVDSLMAGHIVIKGNLGADHIVVEDILKADRIVVGDILEADHIVVEGILEAGRTVAVDSPVAGHILGVAARIVIVDNLRAVGTAIEDSLEATVGIVAVASVAIVKQSFQLQHRHQQ